MANKYIEELCDGYCPCLGKLCLYIGKECKSCEVEQNLQSVVDYFTHYCPYTDKFCPNIGEECKSCEVRQNALKGLENIMQEGCGDG